MIHYNDKSHISLTKLKKQISHTIDNLHFRLTFLKLNKIYLQIKKKVLSSCFKDDV